MNCENGSQNKFNKGTTGTYGSLLMDSVWNSIPCIDLLALADAAIKPKVFGGSIASHSRGDSEQYVNLQFQNQDGGCSNSQTGGVRYLFDLNSPPTLTEPQLITSLSSTLTPVTPKQTRRAVRKRVVSDILNSEINGRTDQIAVNLEQSKPIIEQSQDDVWQLKVDENFEEESSVDLSIQGTPQPKPKRRKHRPKVVIEGQSQKSTTPKAKGSSMGKRKNIRNITPEKSAVRPIRNSCRRKIHSEEEMYDKAFSIGPITPNKSELEMDAKDPCCRAKRNLNFSKSPHEKEVSNVHSRNDCTCSTSEDASLDGYITNFPVIFKKKRTEKCYNSITSKAISSKWSNEMSTAFGVNNQQYYKNILGFGDVEISRKKRSKGRKRVRDMGSFAGLIEAKSPWICKDALAAADYSLNVSTKKRTQRNYWIVPSCSYHNPWSFTNHLGCSTPL